MTFNSSSLNVYERMARAMAIFNSYPVERGGSIHAEHDEMYAGPDPEVVSAEHKAELEELGWLFYEGNDFFHHYT